MSARSFVSAGTASPVAENITRPSASTAGPSPVLLPPCPIGGSSNTGVVVFVFRSRTYWLTSLGDADTSSERLRNATYLPSGEIDGSRELLLDGAALFASKLMSDVVFVCVSRTNTSVEVFASPPIRLSAGSETRHTAHHPKSPATSSRNSRPVARSVDADERVGIRLHVAQKHVGTRRCCRWARFRSTNFSNATYRPSPEIVGNVPSSAAALLSAFMLAIFSSPVCRSLTNTL